MLALTFISTPKFNYDDSINDDNYYNSGDNDNDDKEDMT